MVWPLEVVVTDEVIEPVRRVDDVRRHATLERLHHERRLLAMRERV